LLPPDVGDQLGDGLLAPIQRAVDFADQPAMFCLADLWFVRH
jgi:hypothetical protein